MQRVHDDIFRLGSRHHNHYIVTEGGRATIVDAGGLREWPRIVAGLASLNMTCDDVEAVIITHGHSDHIGGARDAIAAGVDVRVHEHEAARATGRAPQTQVAPTDLPLWKPAVWSFVASMLRAGAARTPKLPHVTSFSDGEVLDLPGRPQAIHTPGHTEGHSAFYLASSRVLFSGDALVTRSLIGGPSGPQILDGRFHADAAGARASLRKLTHVDTNLILPGHGEPWHGSIDDALAAAGA